MLYSEIIAVCSQIHTKHINTLCGQNVELLSVKLAVHWAVEGYRPQDDRHAQGDTRLGLVLHVTWFKTLNGTTVTRRTELYAQRQALSY